MEEPYYEGHGVTKTKVKSSKNLSELGLLKPGYKTLRKVLEVIGKQDLVDDEIVFVE